MEKMHKPKKMSQSESRNHFRKKRIWFRLFGKSLPTEAMKVLDDAMSEAKYKSFGKIKFRNSVKGNKEIIDLQNRKYDAMTLMQMNLRK